MAEMTLEEAVTIARQAEKESQAFRCIAEAGRAIAGIVGKPWQHVALSAATF